jgi:hypothetical protein
MKIHWQKYENRAIAITFDFHDSPRAMFNYHVTGIGQANLLKFNLNLGNKKGFFRSLNPDPSFVSVIK